MRKVWNAAPGRASRTDWIAASRRVRCWCPSSARGARHGEFFYPVNRNGCPELVETADTTVVLKRDTPFNLGANDLRSLAQSPPDLAASVLFQPTDCLDLVALDGSGIRSGIARTECSARTMGSLRISRSARARPSPHPLRSRRPSSHLPSSLVTSSVRPFSPPTLPGKMMQGIPG